MKSFDDFDDDFYDKVDRHKDKLVADMLDNPSQTIFSRIFNCPSGFEDFFDEILEEMDEAPSKRPAPTVTITFDGYSVDFQGSKSQPLHADFFLLSIF